MICPYYKNSEVFNGFNEIIEALGGRPMTEEEFRNPELRNLRSGTDYSAMEATYRIYNRNGGNMLDMTPQGKPSVLFQTLLDHFGGDRQKAIIAKSNVYSDEFVNWFGDWGRFKTMDTKNNLFTPTGEVNWNYFELLLDSYHNNLPDSMFSHGRYTLATRPENHFAGEKNTLNHIKFVTQSMLNLLEGKYDMDLPFVSEARASMQNQKDLMVLAAMFHDAAKPYRHGDIHGWESADILRDLLGVDYNNRVAEWAVRHHMPMPFSHKAEFSLSNPEAIEVAKNIARDARRVGIDANTAINAFVLINAADVINGRELNVDDNWAKKAGEEGLKKYNGDISVKNVLSVELKEKVALLKKAFDEIKDEDFGDTAYNYSHQERFNYQAFPEGGREDKKLPYLNNTEYTGVSKVVDENGEPLVVWHGTRKRFEEFDKKEAKSPSGRSLFAKPDKDLDKAFYFTDSKKYGEIRGIAVPVYLNLKRPFTEEILKRVNKPSGIIKIMLDHYYDNGKFQMHTETVADAFSIAREVGEDIDGVIGIDMGETDHEFDFAVKEPNQIKHVENLGTWSPLTNNIYYLMVGQRGAKSIDDNEQTSLRINNLAIAKQMETAGKNATTIKIATGWERGVDGKWRYEIPDVELKEDGFGDYEIRAVVGNSRNNYVQRDISEVIDLSNLPPIYREELEYVGVIRIYDDFSDPERGSYTIDDGRVIFSINLGADESIKSILAHEFQHFIQEREGFKPGGNTYMSTDAYLKQKGVYDEYQELLNLAGEYSRTVQKILSQDDLYVKYENILYMLDKVTDMIPSDTSEQDALDFVKDMIPEWEEGISYYNLANLRKEVLLKLHKNELDEAEKKDIETNKKLSEIQSNIPSSYDSYRRLAGEAEARAVGRRTSLSEEERLTSLLKDDIYEDVAEEDLLFLYGTQDVAQKDIDTNFLSSTNITDAFGNQIATKLLNGLTVSSRDIMIAMLANGIFHPTSTDLANILSKHDVPVRLGQSMNTGELAETITDDGGSVILINPNEFQQISRGYFGITIMHEIIHAITVDIIDHPKTAEDRAFVELNKKVFNRMSSLFRKDGAIKFDVLSGMHCLDNEKEFAAYFASDPTIRHAIFEMADAIDRTRHIGLFDRLKRLVNKLSIAFANRAIFKATDSEQVRMYQKTFEDYLYNRPSIKRGNIPSKSYLKAVYQEVDLGVLNHEQFLDSMKRLELMRDAERNFVMLGTERYDVTISLKHKPGTVLITSWDRVKDALATRINALRASNLDSVTKSRFLQITLNQLEMFAIDEAGKYYAIQNLLDTAIPQIIKDVDDLRQIRRESGQFTSGDYMYQMHANLGMYNSVFNSIKKMLDDELNLLDMVSAFNAKVTKEEDKITIEDLREVERHLDNAINFTLEGINVVEYMLKENVIHKLKTIANEVGNPEMDAYLNALNSDVASDAIDDIGTLSSWAGAADSSSNEAVRTIAYIINKAMTTATLNSSGKATDLLKLKYNLKKGEKEWHLYETDENGNFTGYLVRDLNFGRFYKNYNKMIELTNKDIRKIFDLPDLPLESRVAPEVNKTAIIDGVEMTPKEYFDRKKEEWLQLNAERRYKPKYYEYYSKLPLRVKDSMSEIRVQINAILNNYEDLYDSDGHPHYEKLSQADWEKLNSLWELRRALRSERDEYGNLKKGQDLEDAKALKELYEKLYKYDENGNEREKKFDVRGWKRARLAVIDKYGEGSKELDAWDERNTRKSLKKNSYGEAIVFKKIEEEFGGVRPQYGEEYERLGQEKLEILNNYKLASGEVDINTLPDVIKNIVIKIDNKRAKIRKEARANNKDFAQQAAKYKEIQDKYIKYVETREFKKVLAEIRKEAERRAMEQDDADALDAFSTEDFMYSMLQDTYGYYYGGSDDIFGFDPGEFIPYSWLTVIEARDRQYMDYQPNDAWIDKAENDLSNPDFDESYGTQWVPKRSIYDNSEQYARIFGKNGVGGSETLRALYEGVLQTIAESNQMYNRQYADNFLLPQKECTFLGRLRRKPFWSGIWNYIRTLGGMLGTIDPDTSTFAANKLVGKYDDPNDTEKGEVLLETTDGRYREVGGTYPDGRSFHIIPLYFTRRMKNPQYISRDLIDITASYYKMAQLYKQRADIRDDCEAILDMLKMQQFKTPDYNHVVKTIRRIGGLNNNESNTYQYAKRLIERDLYDIQRLSIGFKLYDFSRILSLWKRWTTARNLGLNPKVAFVGFLTTSFSHILNGLVGYKYGRKEMWRANNIVLKEFGKSLFTDGTFLGQRLTKNRVMLILEMMDMSNQLDRKTEHSNRNRWLLVIYKNSTFGLMSAADIASKATIAVSTLLSYRYVDGKFMTRHMIEESKEQLGDNYEEMLRKFDSSNITCYDIFIDGDEKLQIDPQYEQAWNEVRHTVVNKAIKNAEQADGMATRLQKAMMTRNFVGAFVLIHRQYIPLMIQQTWGARVYDYDAQEYKNAQFRTMYNYISRLCASNALAAAGGGAFVGVALGGFGVVPLFGGVAGLLISLSKKYISHTERKSFKEAIRDKEFFDSGGSTKARANSVANKYQVKQTILEVALINCFIAPLANFMAAAADGWDKDDKLTYQILQWLAYAARAFLFEANTKYNLMDLSNNIQSATAATSVSEGLADIISGTGLNLFYSSLHGKNQAGSIVYDIYDVYQQEKNSDPDDDVIKNSKTYKGWKRWLRNIFKLFPIHNAVEQAMDPEAKRRYQENKIMRMSKEDKRSWLYEALLAFKEGRPIFDL